MSTTGMVMTVTDELLAELEAAADVFPDYEWDSNTEPFFNGPSGESLGGGSTGFYCVYGQPFEIDDETYDGPTLVEACPLEQAKFICEAKPTIKMLTAELRRLRAENAELAQSLAESRANDQAAMGWLTSLRWASGDRGERMLPELVTHIEGLAKDAGRYAWTLNQAWFQSAFERYDPEDNGTQRLFESECRKITDIAMYR